MKSFPTRHLAHRRLVGALVGAAVSVVAATSLAGCGAESANAAAVRGDGSVDLSKVTLTVGDQKGGSQALLKAAGALDRIPYKITWKTFTSGPPLLEALNAGAIDIGGVGNTPPLFAAAGKKKIEVVSGARMGAKGDAIVVPKDSPIGSVADLKGKTVAVAEGSSANYNLLAQLAKAGLDYKDVDVKALQPADALAAFTNRHVDAWAIWDPYTSQAELEANARVLVDGGGTVNGMTFQAANPDALDDKATSAAIEDYLGRIARAQVWSNTHRAEWAKVWAAETGLAPAVTRRAVDRRQATPTPISGEVTSSEQEMADAFVKAGLLPAKFDVAKFFTAKYNSSVPAA
jgi:sulfonate transport system substrate-binding protein